MTKRTESRPTHKTFYLAHPRDYFDKLEWEFECLESIPRKEDRHRAFQTMNCFTTAWHMTDWVYDFMSDEQRAWRSDGKIDVSGYQGWARKQCGALQVCRQIATATKHSQVTKYDDDSISTDHLNMVAPGGNKRLRAEPSILISGAQWYPEHILQLVVNFWRDELNQLGMLVAPSPWGKMSRNDSSTKS
jgi:hypothetical protein